jgi:hypothetical protein
VRALSSWIRRLPSGDERNAALRRLAELLDGFSEGHETADLIEAARVLCETRRT